MDLKLFFGSHLVGMIERAFWSDDTGYGEFRSALSKDAPSRDRVWQFIAFSEEWHRRLKAGRPIDAAEFDTYRDIHASGEWRTVAPDGTRCIISCPVFFEGEVSWRPAPNRPS